MLTRSQTRNLNVTRQEDTRRDQRWALAILVFILAAVGVIGVLVYDPNDRKYVSWESLGLMVRPEKGFQMGRVAFGMTPSMVGRLHPGNKAGADTKGRTVMSFAYDGADYTVWFLDQSNGQLAYRIRFHRLIESGDEEQILALLGQRFGRPVSGQCEVQLMSNARDCFYDWRINSIDVNALVQAPPPVGPTGSVGLMLTAENVEIAARLADNKPQI